MGPAAARQTEFRMNDPSCPIKIFFASLIGLLVGFVFGMIYQEFFARH